MSNFSENLKKQNARVKWIISGLDWNSLNDWERARFEEWEIMSDKGKWLSERQMEILENAYKEKGQ